MQKYHTFSVDARRRMIMKPAEMKEYIAKHGNGSDYSIEHIVFTARLYKDDSKNWIVDLQYGYKTWDKECVEDFASALPGHKYKMVYQILPKENDIIVDEKSGRKFRLEKDLEGFLVYKFPMVDMATGKTVAYLRAEEYYKD
jgi:hypothetical protein